jgi:hypothetical protein
MNVHETKETANESRLLEFEADSSVLLYIVKVSLTFHIHSRWFVDEETGIRAMMADKTSCVFLDVHLSRSFFPKLKGTFVLGLELSPFSKLLEMISESTHFQVEPREEKKNSKNEKQKQNKMNSDTEEKLFQLRMQMKKISKQHNLVLPLLNLEGMECRESNVSYDYEIKMFAEDLLDICNQILQFSNSIVITVDPALRFLSFGTHVEESKEVSVSGSITLKASLSPTEMLRHQVRIKVLTEEKKGAITKCVFNLKHLKEHLSSLKVSMEHFYLFVKKDCPLRVRAYVQNKEDRNNFVDVYFGPIVEN